MGARLVHARKKVRRRAHAAKRKGQENVTGNDSDAQDLGRGADSRRGGGPRRPQGGQQ